MFNYIFSYIQKALNYLLYKCKEYNSRSDEPPILTPIFEKIKILPRTKSSTATKTEQNQTKGHYATLRY